MLIDKVESCTSSLYELSDLNSAKVNLDAFENAINALPQITSMITGFVSTIEELNKTSFCSINFSVENIEKLNDTIVACASAVNEQRLNKNDVSALKSVFSSQIDLLQIMWKTNAQAYVNPLISYLSLIETFAENKQKISHLISVLKTAASAPPTAQAVKAFIHNIEQANAISSSFTMSNEIRSFLQKIRNGKATFSDITPGVNAWISEYNLGSKIKLSF